MVKRIAIVGSRTPKSPSNDEQVAEFAIIERHVRALVWKLEPGSVVVSGGAHGVDRIAAESARLRGLVVVEHLPDWSKGRGAGMTRNTTIVEDATEVHAFPSSWSRGTWDTIEKAQRAGKLAMVYGPFEVAPC